MDDVIPDDDDDDDEVTTVLDNEPVVTFPLVGSSILVAGALVRAVPAPQLKKARTSSLQSTPHQLMGCGILVQLRTFQVFGVRSVA